MPKAYCPSTVHERSPGIDWDAADVSWGKSLPLGTRIELSPATDLWMRGARFGEIVQHGTTTCRIRVDGLRGHKRLAYGLIYAALS